MHLYLTDEQLLVTALYERCPIESMDDIPVNVAIHALAFLGPYIDIHHEVFAQLIRFVNFLAHRDSVYFDDINGLWEDSRDVGNFLLEYYRGLERRLGIPIEESRISEQD